MKAVLLSYNWETGETLSTAFEGAECEDKAVAFRRAMAKDFAKDAGWEHGILADAEARAARPKRWGLE